MENEPTIPVLRDLKTDFNSNWLSQALGFSILSFSWKFLKRSPGCVILCYNVVSEAGSFPKTSLVIKCHDMDDKIRSTQVLSLMYERELYFYRNIAQLIELNSPVVYKTIQQSNEFYYVIMENLLEKWSSVRLMSDGALSGDDMKKSLSDIRKLHVKFWGNEQLLNAYPFFEKDVLYDQLQRILEFKESWKMVKAQLPLKASWGFKTANGFPENMQKLIDYLDYCAIDDNSLKYYKKANSILATRPFTLIHGDLNCSNFFFGKGDKSNEVCWIDWGMTRSGPVALDFLTLWSTISITKNKEVSMELMTTYYEKLCEDLPSVKTSYPLELILNDVCLFFGANILAVVTMMATNNLTQGAWFFWGNAWIRMVHHLWFPFNAESVLFPLIEGLDK